MDGKNGFVITTRDRVLRAWLHSTELVRDYQAYAGETPDDREIAALFAEFAEDEARHAAKLLERLRQYEEARQS